METRCLTVFRDEEEIVVMCHQVDGCPTGHGAELKKFLSGFSVVVGYWIDGLPRQASGMSCLAAQTVAYFKGGIGQVYLYQAGTRDCGEKYIYTLSSKDGKVWLKLQAKRVTCFLPSTKREQMPCLFEGFIEGFDPEKAEAIWEDRPEDLPNDFLESEKVRP